MLVLGGERLLEGRMVGGDAHVGAQTVAEGDRSCSAKRPGRCPGSSQPIRVIDEAERGAYNAALA